MRELWEEAGIKTTPPSPATSPSGSYHQDAKMLEAVKDEVTLTVLDQERIEHGLMYVSTCHRHFDSKTPLLS